MQWERLNELQRTMLQCTSTKLPRCGKGSIVRSPQNTSVAISSLGLPCVMSITVSPLERKEDPNGTEGDFKLFLVPIVPVHCSCNNHSIVPVHGPSISINPNPAQSGAVFVGLETSHSRAQAGKWALDPGVWPCGWRFSSEN
uniref:Uncharacterized protein n=1 Tax=Eutreptiella gymnastica TaxID=73025 RepID=A0A7S1J768_9EUGL